MVRLRFNLLSSQNSKLKKNKEKYNNKENHFHLILVTGLSNHHIINILVCDVHYCAHRCITSDLIKSIS